jgi:hypothetical protein
MARTTHALTLAQEATEAADDVRFIYLSMRQFIVDGRAVVAF